MPVLFNRCRDSVRRLFYCKENNTSNYENDNDLATSLLGISGLKLNMSPLPRKNMTTREILEYRLANYNDDMELKTPYRDNSYVDFDGENLRWIQNNQIKEIMDAQSGQDDYQ